MSDDKPPDGMAPNAAPRLRESQALRRERLALLQAEQRLPVATNVVADALL
jgi:hypothetical protein